MGDHNNEFNIDLNSEIGEIAVKFNDVNHAEADIYTLFKYIFNNA